MYTAKLKQTVTLVFFFSVGVICRKSRVQSSTNNFPLQQPSLIPLSGVGYMDQITPLRSIIIHKPYLDSTH